MPVLRAHAIKDLPRNGVCVVHCVRVYCVLCQAGCTIEIFSVMDCIELSHSAWWLYCTECLHLLGHRCDSQW